MTKINENGQIEWTFEDLDLSGTEDQIIEEMNLIEREQTILRKAMKSLEGQLYLKASERFCYLSEKWLTLSQVRHLIYKLIMRGNEHA